MNARFAKFTGFALALWLLAACQPVQPETVQAAAQPEFALTESVVIDGAGPITASDPAQAQAEAEFRVVAVAAQEAFYAGDAEGTLSYYADDVIVVLPELQEIVGKDALAEGLIPYMEGNHIVGKFTIKRIWVDGDRATRYDEYEEVVTPKAGGPAQHYIGRCILNWEKIDGEWKVVSEFVNYLDPPTEWSPLAAATE